MILAIAFGYQARAGNSGNAEAVAVVKVNKPRATALRCPSDKQGLAFYRQRFVDHMAVRSVSVQWPPGRKPRNCADASYLAGVWEDRSRQARSEAERWKASVGQVITKLERAMQGSPMAGTAVSLERAGRKHGVSPYFIVAVAATESSIGRVACGFAGRNAWGLGNCGTAWTVPSFYSWADAYDYYGNFIASRWPGHSTPYSFVGYAACDACWGRKVSEWMSTLFGVAPKTSYP